jgi:DNA-directed RNA polymerase omega subunit
LPQVVYELVADFRDRSVSSTCVLSASESLLRPTGRSRESKNKSMTVPYKVNGDGLTGVANEGTWPGIDSRFRLIIVAGLRTKQLLHGSKPRIEADKGRRRNTSIALEEVKRGLVPFTKFDTDEEKLLATTNVGLI